MKLTIGKLAKHANVTIETIRYYQRKGLLEEPLKPSTGYRVYPEEAISRIQFIKRAQSCGFALKEILELISMGSNHCPDVQKMAEQKLQQIDKQIKDLSDLRVELNGLLKGCKTSLSIEHCSLIDTLSKESPGNAQSSKNKINPS